MQSKTADAPPAAGAMDDLRQALPSVVVGDAPAVERKHEWPGSLFVMLSYVAAVGLAGSAVGSAGWAAFTGQPGPAGWAVVAGAGAVLQWRLARAVESFSRWGWFGAMAELGAAAAAKVWALFTGGVAGAAVGLVIDALWIGYFWDRRRQFDVDDL